MPKEENIYQPLLSYIEEKNAKAISEIISEMEAVDIANLFGILDDLVGRPRYLCLVGKLGFYRDCRDYPWLYGDDPATMNGVWAAEIAVQWIYVALVLTAVNRLSNSFATTLFLAAAGSMGFYWLSQPENMKSLLSPFI